MALQIPQAETLCRLVGLSTNFILHLLSLCYILTGLGQFAMVCNQDLRNLEKLAGQYGILQKTESDAWPSSLQSTVRHVELLAKIDFQSYSSSCSSSSRNEPWKRENTARTEWLVMQASRLSQNTANENSWRMRIENAILERFSVEVAWYVLFPRLLEASQN